MTQTTSERNLEKWEKKSAISKPPLETRCTESGAKLMTLNQALESNQRNIMSSTPAFLMEALIAQSVLKKAQCIETSKRLLITFTITNQGFLSTSRLSLIALSSSPRTDPISNLMRTSLRISLELSPTSIRKTSTAGFQKPSGPPWVCRELSLYKWISNA